MIADFSGRWTAQLTGDAFLPGIEAGSVTVRIDHVEPLLQLTVAAAAPGYAFGHFACNYRTDGTEMVTSTHGMKVRTKAHWEKGALDVETSIEMGRFSKQFYSTWSVSKGRRVLTVRRREGENKSILTFKAIETLPSNPRNS